jgi:phosphoribosylanthranilate isomerase
MFRIKICGVTNATDAIIAVEAGADAIGLNFYEKSPRCVSESIAKQISKAARNQWRSPGELPKELSDFRAFFERSRKRPSSFSVVGVFVNDSTERMGQAWSFANLSAIQLHGDEPPEVMEKFRAPPVTPLPSTNWKVIRARRFDDEGVAGIARDVEECEAAGRRPDAVLVDAATPGRYGGTGETVSWVGLADHPRWLGDTPLILAGGLTPDNVAEAIRIVRPHGVDVASGVESAPGKKDPHKVRDFIAAARAALDALPTSNK